MKRNILFLLALTVILNIPAEARNLDTSAIRSRAQDAGLIFMIGNSSSLSLEDYEGGAGFIYYLLNDVALRGSVGIDYEHESEPSPIQNRPASRTEKTQVSFLTGFRFNLISNLSVIAYSGFEGLFSYGITDKEHPNHSNLEPAQTIEDNSYGGGIFLGAEWFFIKNISLSCEYKMRYSKTWSKETTTIDQKEYAKESATVDKLRLTGENFNIALTIYFN